MKPGITIRPAALADANAIHSLVSEARLNPMGIDWRRFRVAVDAGGKVIGCGQVKLHSDGSRELASIVVAAGSRRQGAARAIIERLLAENPGRLYLTCRSSLQPFYHRFGFQAVVEDEMPPYFRRISFLFKLARRLLRLPESLAVMQRGEKDPA